MGSKNNNYTDILTFCAEYGFVIVKEASMKKRSYITIT
jgi:hypothetical protein